MKLRTSIGVGVVLGSWTACGGRVIVRSSVDSGVAEEAGAAGALEDGAAEQAPDMGTPLDAQLDGDAQPLMGDASDGNDASACGVCSGGTTCQNGQCVCPPGLVLCANTCVDEQTDNANCGACGVECTATSPSTAACTAGRCLVGLAGECFGDTFVPPVAIAVDSTSVYWTTGGEGRAGSVMKVPKTGGNETPLAPYALTGPAGIAVDATSVYWVDTWTPSDAGASGTVMKVSAAGGTEMTLASGLDAPCGIAVDATNVYWTNVGSNFSDGTVMTVSTTGGIPTTLASLSSPGGIAVDDTSVYFTTIEGGGSVMTVSKGAGPGPGTTLASPETFSGGCLVPLAVDDTSVYWIAGGGVGTVAKNGGAPMALVGGQDAVPPDGIAVDATNVYWLSDGDAPVMKISKGGGTPTPLASGLCAALVSGGQMSCRVTGGIAVDATSVYWATVTAADSTTCYEIQKLTPK